MVYLKMYVKIGVFWYMIIVWLLELISFILEVIDFYFIGF